MFLRFYFLGSMLHCCGSELSSLVIYFVSNGFTVDSTFYYIFSRLFLCFQKMYQLRVNGYQIQSFQLDSWDASFGLFKHVLVSGANWRSLVHMFSFLFLWSKYQISDSNSVSGACWFPMVNCKFLGFITKVDCIMKIFVSSGYQEFYGEM